jgi:hypothetical protein
VRTALKEVFDIASFAVVFAAASLVAIGLAAAWARLVVAMVVWVWSR